MQFTVAAQLSYLPEQRQWMASKVSEKSVTNITERIAKKIRKTKMTEKDLSILSRWRTMMCPSRAGTRDITGTCSDVPGMRLALSSTSTNTAILTASTDAETASGR